MGFAPSSLKDVLGARFDSVIDVRAPSEFAADHLPGAINLPVLDDAERARIGTIYVQQSAFLARKVGAALVARNAAAHIEGPLAGHDGGWQPLVYCWRGGQRSNSFASILAQIGWRVEVLEGGYRRYRTLVRDSLYVQHFPAPIIVIDGYTGTAKTELLHLAAERGAQILDLEGLAHHRGSVFGAQGAQPSQKAFETALAERIQRLDPAKPVLVEAESSKIGARVVPPSLWSAMCAAPRIMIDAPLPARAAYLRIAYADVVEDKPRLADILHALVAHQGHQRIGDWQALAASGAYDALAAELMRHHYDPRYAKGARRAKAQVIARLEAEDLAPASRARLADRLVETSETYTTTI